MDFSLQAFKCVTYIIIENFTYYLPLKISIDNNATESNVLFISFFGVLEERSSYFLTGLQILRNLAALGLKIDR